MFNSVNIFYFTLYSIKIFFRKAVIVKSKLIVYHTVYTLNITCVYLQDNDASLTQVKFSRSATSFVNEQGVEAFPDENVLDLVVTYQVPLYPLGSAIFAALSSGQLLADF